MTKTVRKSPTTRSATAQRVNVGVTGLAAIFLVVMAAAATVRGERPAKPVDAKAETLAVLGVAPSSGSAATMTGAPVSVTPAARSAMSRVPTNTIAQRH